MIRFPLKSMFCALFAMSFVCSLMASPTPPSTSTPPPSTPSPQVKPAKPVRPAASILFLNVNDAISATEWDVIEKAFTRIRIRVTTTPIDVSISTQVVTDIANLNKVYGDQSLVVALEKKPDQPLFVVVPKRYCSVNLADLSADTPESEKLNTRITKRAMKALARLCDRGSSMDQMCVMLTGSDASLKALDAVSASYGPNTYFPLLNFMDALPVDITIPIVRPKRPNMKRPRPEPKAK